MKKLIPATLLIALIILVSSAAFNPELESPKSKCIETSRGWAIPWKTNQPLQWEDFQASKKRGKGFAIASASCNFGYDMVDGDIRLFVRFYCDESWKNSYLIEDVLAHEQLHFDICEYFGRRFYKEILALEKKQLLNKESLKTLFDRLQIEYEDYQELYDDESNHSTNGPMQRAWNKKIADEIKSLEKYSGYASY